jgi:hypothetical protein
MSLAEAACSLCLRSALHGYRPLADSRYAGLPYRNSLEIRPKPGRLRLRMGRVGSSPVNGMLNRGGLGVRHDKVAEGNRRQIRPQDAQFLKLLVGSPLHQQRNEIAHPAGLEPRVSVLHYHGNVVVRKSCVFLGETTLDVANKHPLFLRHPDILTVILTVVKMGFVNHML